MIAIKGFPEVKLPDGTNSFGGSQKWFHHVWRKMSGCASVSATNLAAFDRIGMAPAEMRDGIPVYAFKAFRKQMNLMFREYMTSGMRGFPDPDLYRDRFIAYAARYGVLAEWSHLYEWQESGAPKQYIRERLLANRPVALLILMHAAKVLDDVTWHWMTITGYDEAPDEIVVSNYGKKERYGAEIVFDPAPGNQVYLQSFDLVR